MECKRFKPEEETDCKSVKMETQQKDVEKIYHRSSSTVPVPPLDGDKNKKYHAFLTYSSEDVSIAEKLFEDLTEAGFSICFAPNDFTPGNTVLDNIHASIKDSRRVIHLYSKHFQESPWCTAEMCFTHDQQYEDGVWQSVYILYNMEECDIPHNMKQHFIKGRFLMYDSKEKENPEFWDNLCQELAADDVKIVDTLPCGNIAQGQAWSYFYGYLNLVFEYLDDRIVNCKFFDSNNRRIAKRMFILIPESCRCPSKFKDADPRITNAGKLETIHAKRAGILERPYDLNVHQIKLDNGEVYYFVGEFSSQVLSMQQMLEGGIAGMNEEEKRKQTVIFYHTLRHILSHSEAKHCNDKAYIHMYQDKPSNGSLYPLADELVKLIKVEIEKDIKREKQSQREHCGMDIP